MLRNISMIVVVAVLVLGVSGAFSTSQVYAQPPFEVPPIGGLPVCIEDLNLCNSDLDICTNDLAACEAMGGQQLPGDGYANPDVFDVSGHGPALSYMDNGDGTFTDGNTGLMWEIKDNNGGIHDKDNTYIWTNTGTVLDGPLFTVFLDTLNNKCDGDETTSCATDADCTGIGNGLCGHAGYSDWRIPNIKEMQSIIDYSINNPAYSAPGLTANSLYWSATTNNDLTTSAWGINLAIGAVFRASKGFNLDARAVRP